MSFFLADLVLRIDVDGDPRAVVHVNTHLVEAANTDEAYDKALALGRDGELEDKNTAGQRVRTRFVGLRELTEIHEPLEDGAEIAFQERVGLSDLETRRLVPPRDRLGAFRRDLPAAPDYASAAITAEVDELLPPRVITIDHAQIMIPAGGEAAARRFYGELLGMDEIEKPEPLRVRGGLWMQAGDRQLHLGVDAPGAAQPRTRAHVAYQVTRLDELRARLEAAGVELSEGERLAGMRRFELRDPFGNRVELLERG